LDQGAAQFLGAPPRERRVEIAAWFSPDEAALNPTLAPGVVSTGLHYLVLPVRSRSVVRCRWWVVVDSINFPIDRHDRSGALTTERS
jgi:hypothetical protein